MATIAALGTGVMGAPMARNLARAGHEVRAWNRSPDKAAPAARRRRRRARRPASAAAAGADVVLTMLADADAVLDVARRASLAEGQIWWQASTIGIEGIEQCAALAQETGATLVDAPVLGTQAAGRGGQARGPRLGPRRRARRAARRSSTRSAQRTMRLGPAGTATRLKLAVNLWVLAVTQGTAETIAFAQALGVEPEWVLEAARGRRARPALLPHEVASSCSTRTSPRRSRSRWRPRTRAWWPRRPSATGPTCPIAAAIAERFTQATEAGHGDEDMAATYRLSRPR